MVLAYCISLFFVLYDVFKWLLYDNNVADDNTLYLTRAHTPTTVFNIKTKLFTDLHIFSSCFVLKKNKQTRICSECKIFEYKREFVQIMIIRRFVYEREYKENLINGWLTIYFFFCFLFWIRSAFYSE